MPRADGKFSTEDTLVKCDFEKQNLRKTLHSGILHLGSTSSKVINHVGKDTAVRMFITELFNNVKTWK